MNFRNIALVAALVSITGVASAQNMGITVVSGATQVGNVITVSPGAGSFVIRLSYIGTAQISGSTLNIALAHGETNLTTAGTAGGVLSGPLSVVRSSKSYWNNFSTVVSATNQFDWNAAAVGGFGADPNGGGAGPAFQNGLLNGGTGSSMAGGTDVYTSARAFVSTAGVQGTFSSPTFTNGLAICDVTVNYAGMLNGDIYGDSTSESGLFVSSAGTGNSSSRNSRLGTVGLSSAKYQVQAVPEPATMTALGLGLAAIARRRRSSKK